jgi:hypothetical protein
MNTHTKSHELIQLITELHPEEVELVGPDAVASLARIVAADEPLESAVESVPGGDDFDFGGVLEFVANVLGVIGGFLQFRALWTSKMEAREIRARLSAVPGLKSAVNRLSDEELLRIRDRLLR